MRQLRWICAVFALACGVDPRSTVIVPDGGIAGAAGEGSVGNLEEGSGGSGASGDGRERVEVYRLEGAGGQRNASGGGGSAAGASGSEVDGGAPVDVTPPRLVSVSPSEGTFQVASEQVHLVFSEAMDRGSVEAAFPNGAGFMWSKGDTEVSFRLVMPFAGTPQLFDIVVPASVRDAAGNQLGQAQETSVVLASLIRVELPLEGGFSGNQIAGDNGDYTFVQAGDTASGLIHFGAISFSLVGLPSLNDVIRVRSATLHLQVCDLAGDPSSPALGGFLLERVAFSARADIDEPVLTGTFAPLLGAGPVELGRVIRLDVAADFGEVWSQAAERLQYRIGPRQTNADAVADLIYLRRGANENDSVVGAGLPEPDPENIARIELEYFE